MSLVTQFPVFREYISQLLTFSFVFVFPFMFTIDDVELVFMLPWVLLCELLWLRLYLRR